MWRRSLSEEKVDFRGVKVYKKTEKVFIYTETYFCNNVFMWKIENSVKAETEIPKKKFTKLEIAEFHGARMFIVVPIGGLDFQAAQF